MCGGVRDGDVKWSFSNGDHTVRLHYALPYWSSQSKSFDFSRHIRVRDHILLEFFKSLTFRVYLYFSGIHLLHITSLFFLFISS